MKWYKHDPDAFLAGTAELTLEEIGAYSLILDLLYSRDGKVPDDDRFICRNLRCNPRTWCRLKAKLLAKGKIRITQDGNWTANRVELELNSARIRLEFKANAARKRNENNGPTPVRAREQPQPHPDKKKDGSHLSTKQRPTITRATQFPLGWVFGEIEFAAAVAIRPDWSRVKGNQEFTRFHDHALAKGSAYKNWPAAWRNWVGSKFQDNQGGGNGRQQSLSELAFELADEVRQREREAGIGRPDDPIRRD